MSRPERVVVLAGEPAPGSPLRPEDLADRVASLGDGIDLREFRRLAAEAELLWLPPWAFLDAAFREAVERFRSASDRIAATRPLLRDPDATIRLPRLVLLAKPGASRPRGAALAACGGERVASSEVTLEVRPPSLSAHLRGVDRHAAVEARLREEAGERARASRLALLPLARLVAAMARSSGDRKAALARATLESFRDVLVQAKLWERSAVDPGGA